MSIFDHLISINRLHKTVGANIILGAVKSELKLTILENPPKGDVLVIAPHPDDETLGLAGTIKLHTNQNDKVTVLFLTNGKNQIRHDEAEKVCRILGATPIFWDYADGELKCNNQTIKQLNDEITKSKPAIIDIPFPTDPHPDHIASGEILYKTLKEINFNGPIFCYEVWQPVYANRLVKIDRVLDTKKEAIAIYTSQMKDRQYSDAIIGLNRYRAGMFEAGKFAEAFFVCNKELYLKLFEIIKK